MSQNIANRNAHLEELQRLQEKVRAARNIESLKPVYYRLEELAEAYFADSSMQNAIASVRISMVKTGQQILEQESAGERESASMVVGDPFSGPMHLPVLPYSSPYSGTQLATALPPAPPPRQSPPSIPAAQFNWKRAVIVGAVVGLLISAGGIFTFRNARKRAEAKMYAAAGAARVSVKTQPSGASIRVNGEVKCTSGCNFDLPAGSYLVQAVLPGFETASQSLDVIAGAPADLNIPLEPVRLSVHMFTDLQSGRVSLDGSPLGDLQDGQLVLDRVTPGKHSVRITNAATETAFEFESRLGKAPLVTSPVTGKNVLAILVANAGTSAMLHSSAKLKVQVDGSPVGETADGGLLLENLPLGDRELAVNDGAVDRKLLFSVGPQPTLTAYLKLDLNAGSLFINAGDLDDVSVFLNDTEMKRKTKAGQLRLPGLLVREYTVRVAKNGYSADPPKSVQIVKGQESRVEFALKPIPKLASLRIRGAAPGVAVRLDGSALGVVSADGTFNFPNVQPGEHTVELHGAKFAPKRLPRQFRAGEAVDLMGSDVILSAAPAMLRVNVLPANAQLLVRKADESTPRPASGNPLTLGEGTWVITGRAANYTDGSVTVQLGAGESRNVDLALTAIQAAPVKRAGTMAEWEQPGEWLPQGGWAVHKGGNYVLYKIAPPNGTFTFNIALLKGRRLQWFANYMDAKNHVLYQLDKKHFFRREIINGHSTEYKVPHNLEKQDSYTMQVDISPGSIRHQLHDGTRWMELDAFSVPGRNLAQGKFGLYIPGNDIFGLSNFRFSPR